MISKIPSCKSQIFVLLVFTFIGFSTQIVSQTANNYTYTTSTGATLESFTTANSTGLLSPCSDDGRSGLTNIGFNFTFEGTNYTQFSVNTNGLMSLGPTQVVTSLTNTNFGTTNDGNPKITAAWDDFYLHYGTGSTDATDCWVRYKITGASPNRILKVEWRVRNYSSTEVSNGWCGSGSTFYNFNKVFQVWLYESDGAIEFIYGTGNAFLSSSIGISGATGTNYLSVVSSSHTVSNSTSTTNNTTWPGNGRKYRFVGCTQPTVFTVTGGGTCLSGPSAVGLSGSQTGVNYQLKKNGVNEGAPVAGTGSAISFGNQTDGTYTVGASGSGYCTVTFPSSVSVSLNTLSISGTSSLCAGASTTLTVNGLSNSSGTNYTTTYNSTNGTMQTVFTGNGTFVNGSGTAITAKSLLVGGGGGGGARHGGGGGGGVLYNAAMSIPAGNLPVVIGAGGGAGDYQNNVNHGNGIGAGGNGGNTTFNGSTAYGGGGGKTYDSWTNAGATIASGGGGAGNSNTTYGNGQAAGSQGNVGGNGPGNTNGNAGGGGGAGGAGAAASGNNGGNGGVGINRSAEFGTSVGQSGWFGGGGGGGSRANSTTCGSTGGTAGTGGVGGNGGGGRGGDLGNHTNGTAGLANTGGGGGGNRSCNTTTNFAGFAGGSGVVILNYPAGVWSSSDLSVATVTQTGVVTATASATGGLATITYSSVGGCSTSFIIEKIAAPTITSTVANETCSSLNNGSISAVNISGGLSKVRYIRIKQNLTDAQDGWLHPAELKAFEIFTDADVAAGKTATSSGLSYAGGSYPASNLVDGNPASIYHSGAMGVNEWVEIDLGAEYNLDRIQVWSGNCCYTTRFNDMQLILKNGAGTVIHSRQIAMNDNSGVATSYTFNVLDVSWSDGATTLNRSSLDAGSYTLNYSDASGCGTVAHTKVIGTTNPSLPASVSIAATPGTNVCIGTNVTFTATPTNGGTPTYQWKLNGSNVGTNSSTYSNNALTNTSVVTCEMTSTATCATGSPATSNSISGIVPVAPTAVSGTASAVCQVPAGSGWVRFLDGSGKLVVSINPGSNNLGLVTADAYDHGSSVLTQACNTGTNPSWTTAVLGRSWRITPTNNLGASLELPFEDGEMSNLVTASSNTASNPRDNVTSRGDLKMSRYSGASQNGSWSDNCADGGTSLIGGQLGNGTSPAGIATSQYVQFATPGFSEFWLHGNTTASPLPITLTNFGASCNEKGDVALNWSTASEQNASHFVIERSRDLVTWDVVSTLPAGGNTTTEQLYALKDVDALGGVSYYRLVQVDFDGESEIYGPIAVTCESTEGNSITVFPNPTKADFTVEITSISSVTGATLQLTDLTGKVIASRQVDLVAGKNQLLFSDLDLQMGTYIIRMQSELEIRPVKLVVNR